MKFAFNKLALLPMGGYCAGIDPFAPNAPTMSNSNFGGGQQQQQQQQQMPVASNIMPAGNVQGLRANPADAGNGFDQTAPALGVESPLQKYNDVWDTSKNKDKPTGNPSQDAPPAQQQQEMLDLMKLNYGEFQQAGSKMQFMQGIDSSLVQEALGGNVESFGKMMQQFANNIFSITSHGSSRLFGQYANQRFEQLEGSLGSRFDEFDRKRAVHNLNEAGRTKGLDFNQPALSGLRDMAIDRFKHAYPEATREELSRMAMEYLQDLGPALTGTVGNQDSDKQQQQSGRGYGDLFNLQQ